MDTRDGFCDSLYTSLADAGVFTFRDDEELPVGEDIGGELLRALDHSKIFIPIFSADYASSKWCLMELAHMFKCLGTGTGQRIFPIFYYVTPAEVKHQTGCYKEAFVSHEKEHDEKTVRDWRAALKEATALKGWDIVKTANKYVNFLSSHISSSVTLPQLSHNPAVINLSWDALHLLLKGLSCCYFRRHEIIPPCHRS